MSGFLTKLFGAGKLPPELAAAAQSGQALLVVEGLTLKAKGSMRTPGRMTSGFSARHGGALVVLPDRVLASFARYVLVDEQPSAPATADACTACAIGPGGLTVSIDVARLIRDGTGQVEVELPATIAPEVLAALPVQQWQGRVATPDPQLMLRRI